MQLKIVTPERVVLDDTVEAVYANATDGQLGILPKHVPLVTPLKVAVLSYTKGGQKHLAAVMGGILSTDGESVTVLSDTAELSNEIDTARAEQARQRAEAKLHERSEHTDQATAELALSKALVRLAAK